jgi:hypothetical protein
LGSQTHTLRSSIRFPNSHREKLHQVPKLTLLSFIKFPKHNEKLHTNAQQQITNNPQLNENYGSIVLWSWPVLAGYSSLLLLHNIRLSTSTFWEAWGGVKKIEPSIHYACVQFSNTRLRTASCIFGYMLIIGVIYIYIYII